ncbi:BatD family protein [Mangrovivirga sp. M17]|uniref:BatD family protein n=1 Tax=Mangrovivirga halotolerans TaxID=2993936 RepID=A0ABT3RRT2_9BACT|nr:BatD family protein [Mangrovivirga halotolerans]MCX2744491.1 BatD family protein [Mangrovivirga halotolerans]
MLRTSGKIFKYLLVLVFLCFGPGINAQDIKVELGKSEVALNEMFTITVSVQDGQVRNLSGFPEIPGFIKRGTSRSSSTTIVNSQVTRTFSITQNYLPQKEGTFRVPDFTIKANEENIPVSGKTIKVGPKKQQQYYDPFSDIFGDRSPNRQEPEFIELEDDAFVAVTTDKDEVYVGEGFHMRFSFYVALANKAPLSWHEMDQQLSEIQKVIKPENSWEENFDIRQIQEDRVSINGKPYYRYDLFEATFYPLTGEDIEIPAVEFDMQKSKIAKNRSFFSFGPSRKAEIKTYKSKSKTIKVKPLPDHPLKDEVSVGVFRLEESINKKTLNTGESFKYNITIEGEGNIAGIKLNPDNDKKLDLFDPEESRNIIRRGNSVIGNASYSYFGIPQIPGEYDMSEYFSWVYFDPVKERYDTLKSDIKIIVTGESLVDREISSKALDSFYDLIGQSENDLKSRDGLDDLIPYIFNGLAILLLAFAGWFMFKS